MKINLLFFFILFSQFSFCQKFDVDTLLWSGSPNNRINLVILGDGYQEGELLQFKVDATSFSDSLFSQTPYKEYKNYFNVFTISTPSNESGASHPGTANDVEEPSHPISKVDNYFGSTFDRYGIHRLLGTTKNSEIYNVLANNFPTYDQVFVLVNSPYYGGSGGEIPIASVSIKSEEIAIHELGHSLVGLRDEYFAGDIFALESINMTQQSNPDKVIWKNWINTDGVSVYQHCCGGTSLSWYKPHENCKMQALGSTFCPVCTEGTIEKIHSLISFIDSYVPENPDLNDLILPITFSVDLVEPVPTSLKAQWTLNGTIINNNTDSIFLTEEEIIAGDNQLIFTVTDTSAFLKIEDHESLHFASVIWDVNFNTTSINSIQSDNLTIEIFPNPTGDLLYINITNVLQEDFNVVISDVAGNKLLSRKIKYPGYDSPIPIGHIPSGLYFLNFHFSNNFNITKKILKE